MGELGGYRQFSDAQRADWLRLIRTEHVGPASFRQLLNRFGSAAAALDALPGLQRRDGGSFRLTSPSEAEDEIAATGRLGGRLVASGEPDYPALLRHIPGPPPIVAIAGGDNLNFARTVGIVGARNASASGQRMTKLLAGELGDAGYVVVSGLARGIDAAAHSAALSTGTIAVLAGGLDRIYPEENLPLAKAILDHGGALLTEMPLGWSPRARDFPRRNRLIAGLSLGIVVVEAAKRSGSLITARRALEQNREVFAVPGSPLDPRAEGGNALIQEGAMLITGAPDIIGVLSEADPSRLPLFEDGQDADGPDLDEAVERVPEVDANLRLINALSVTPVAVDDLISTTGIGADVMQALLLELDIAGRIEWSSGQLVALRE